MSESELLVRSATIFADWEDKFNFSPRENGPITKFRLPTVFV
jgi:hypothetical protein